MFRFLKKFFKGKNSPPSPADAPERITIWAGRRPVQQHIYPPVSAGIPRFSVDEILEEHATLIKQLRNLSEHDEVFDLRYRPVIKRYAEYVYLLPASESHHHRGVGGLLGHGLETAKYVLQQAYDRVHGIDLSPLKRKLARERWLFAGFSGGLIHDIGKPVSMRVYSVSGAIWDPFTQPLAPWFQNLPPDDDRLFVTWRRDGQDHRRMGLSVINHVITPEDKRYLHEVEPFMVDHMLQAILGEREQDCRNHLPEMVREADRKSLTKDLQNSNLISDLGPGAGEPLVRLYVLAMKRLVKEGRWRANEPGSVLWVIGFGVYLVFPEVAADITDMLHKDGVPGVPSNEYILAEILEENGILARAPNGNRLWRIWPAVVDAGEEGLLALRLKDPRYVMNVVPPAVPGVVRGEGEEGPASAENVILFNPTAKANVGYQESDSGGNPPWPFDVPSEPPIEPQESPDSQLRGFVTETQGPHTLEELQEYFTRAGLGGQALVKFATEVSQYLRREGVDYKSEPRLLLVWGERKFTNEENLPEVIESLARAKWLILNWIARVHEDPGFGGCLKLEERETTRFWRLVWKLQDAEPLEVRADASLKESPPEPGAPPSFEETHPQEAAVEDLSKHKPPTGGDAEKEPEWVSEVAALLDQDGSVSFDRVAKLVAERTGHKQRILNAVCKHFAVGGEGGKMMVYRLP
jgi:hypothetical protein